jgi:membrane-bound metal-dependent hydrolase YbcI (DUF457 family)
MPSPIAHSTIGYVIYRFRQRQLPSSWGSKCLGPFHFLMIVTFFFSLLPDFDSLIGILVGNTAQYHNNGTHSLIIGFLLALVIGGAVWLKTRTNSLNWFLIILLSYNMHVISDFFTYDTRGVMLFWPLSVERYTSPISLFYGVRWSDGWISVRHLWTLATESLFALGVLFLLRLLGGMNLRVTGSQLSDTTGSRFSQEKK